MTPAPDKAQGDQPAEQRCGAPVVSMHNEPRYDDVFPPVSVMDPMTDESPTWFVYLLRCRDRSLYAGISRDPERRCREHNEHQRLASRYVWSRRPAELVWRLPV